MIVIRLFPIDYGTRDEREYSMFEFLIDYGYERFALQGRVAGTTTWNDIFHHNKPS